MNRGASGFNDSSADNSSEFSNSTLRPSRFVWLTNTGERVRIGKTKNRNHRERGRDGEKSKRKNRKRRATRARPLFRRRPLARSPPDKSRLLEHFSFDACNFYGPLMRRTAPDGNSESCFREPGPGSRCVDKSTVKLSIPPQLPVFH